MAEPDDILVGGEFAGFRAAYAPVVHPAGTAAVRRTVRHRRRRTTVVTAAAVVLAVVIPVGANAALDRRPGPPPAPAQTVTPAPSESTSPPPSTPPPSTASSTPAAPDGRITRSQLLAARLDLVSWPDAPKTCISDDVRLRSGPQTNRSRRCSPGRSTPTSTVTARPRRSSSSPAATARHRASRCSPSIGTTTAGSSPWAASSAHVRAWVTSPSSRCGTAGRSGYTSPTSSPVATRPNGRRNDSGGRTPGTANGSGRSPDQRSSAPTPV